MLGVLAFSALAALVILLADRPWFPSERILPYGRTPFTGYVLRADSDEVAVLADDSRRLVRVNAGDVQSRTFCRTGPNGRTAFYSAPS